MSNAVMSDWPSGSANTGWPSEPTAMLMPGRVQGWPAGTQRAANAAQRLLSQAVAWWDVEQYRDGARFLRNRGTGGELLDLRLGSSVVANSNDPLYLEPRDNGYVYLPSSTTNRLEVASSTAFNVTDLDIRLRVSADSWRPAATRGLMSRISTDPNRAFDLILNTNGTLSLEWYPLGTSASTVSKPSTVAVSASDGDILWIRATLDVDNGAGGYDLKFFTSSTGTTWTQLGSTVTGGATTTVPAVTAPVAVSDGFSWTGRVFRAQLMDAIDGTAVLDIDCNEISSGSATSFTALTGQTVTINRSTSGRKSVAMPSRHKGGRPVMLLGSDDFLEIPAENGWQHGLLNFGQGDSFTVLVFLRQWANSADNGHWISKSPASPSPRWQIQSNGTTAAVAPVYSDGSLLASFANPNLTFGAFNVIGATVDRAAGITQTVIGASRTAGTIARNVQSAANSGALSIGRRSNGTVYQDFEFYGAAIWRGRALSAVEVSALSTYFSGRIA